MHVECATCCPASKSILGCSHHLCSVPQLLAKPSCGMHPYNAPASCSISNVNLSAMPCIVLSCSPGSCEQPVQAVLADCCLGHIWVAGYLQREGMQNSPCTCLSVKYPALHQQTDANLLTHNTFLTCFVSISDCPEDEEHNSCWDSVGSAPIAGSPPAPPQMNP